MDNIEYEHEDGEEMTREKELEIKKHYLRIAFAKDPKYKNMTYSQILQCPENKKRLIKAEQSQRETMEQVIKKKHKELIPEWKDEFALYWTAFLKGEYKSINQYLKRKNFA